jgi:hypothetical protein
MVCFSGVKCDQGTKKPARMAGEEWVEMMGAVMALLCTMDALLFIKGAERITKVGQLKSSSEIAMLKKSGAFRRPIRG